MNNDTELLVQTAQPQLKEPGLYRVIMHNDDFTPMEFVIEVLELYFNMDRISATQVMYDVHMSGKGVCGVYTKDIAETKADQVMEYARSNEHPLLCNIEVV